MMCVILQVHRAAKDADYPFIPDWILIYLKLSDPSQLFGSSLHCQAMFCFPSPPPHPP
jgi:hypothetical protein